VLPIIHKVLFLHIYSCDQINIAKNRLYPLDLQKKLESEEKKSAKNKDGWEKAKEEIAELNKVWTWMNFVLL